MKNGHLLASLAVVMQSFLQCHRVEPNSQCLNMMLQGRSFFVMATTGPFANYWPLFLNVKHESTQNFHPHKADKVVGISSCDCSCHFWGWHCNRFGPQRGGGRWSLCQKTRWMAQREAMQVHKPLIISLTHWHMNSFYLLWDDNLIYTKDIYTRHVQSKKPQKGFW